MKADSEITNPNETFAEMVGIPWHKQISTKEDGYGCSCGFLAYFGGVYGEHIRNNPNPDYAADPRLVLKEMMKREDWPRFLDSIDGMHNCYDYGQEIVWRDWIEVKYLLDTTGKLRDKAIEWLKGRTP